MKNSISDKIFLRKLNKEDKIIFINLRMTYIKETFENVNNLNEMEIENNLEQYFNEHIDKGDFIGLIGNYNENIVSVAFLVIKYFPPNPSMMNGKTGTIFNVYTFPEYRNKGIAKRIVQELINEAKLLDIKSIDLKSTEDGYNLYKNLGFLDDNNYKNMILKL